jgi:hypothetical protein
MVAHSRENGAWFVPKYKVTKVSVCCRNPSSGIHILTGACTPTLCSEFEVMVAPTCLTFPLWATLTSCGMISTHMSSSPEVAHIGSCPR